MSEVAEQTGKRAQIARTSKLSTTFVYVLEAGEYCKVGLTQNFQRRLMEYSTHCPLPVRCAILLEVRTEYGLWLERAIHRQLSEYRVRGEWFRVTVDRAREALEAVQREGFTLGRPHQRVWPDIKEIILGPAAQNQAQRKRGT